MFELSRLYIYLDRENNCDVVSLTKNASFCPPLYGQKFLLAISKIIFLSNRLQHVCALLSVIFVTGMFVCVILCLLCLSECYISDPSSPRSSHRQYIALLLHSLLIIQSQNRVGMFNVTTRLSDFTDFSSVLVHSRVCNRYYLTKHDIPSLTSSLLSSV